MGRHSVFAFLPLLLCTLALAACAHQDAGLAEVAALSPTPALQAPQPAASFAPPALPVLPLLDLAEPRSIAVTAPRTLQAADAVSQSVGTALIGDAMVFHGAAAPGWALYQFSGMYSEDRPYLFGFSLENDEAYLPRHLYIGISDFGSQTWDWYDVNYPGAEFTFGIPQADLPKPSPNGNVFVCVLTMNEWAMLHSLSMSFDYAPPPVDLRAGDGTSELGVDLVWTDPDVTYADGPPLAYDGIAIERATSQAGPWEKLATVARGTTTYSDTTAPALGAVKLYYRLYLDRGLDPSQPGVPDMGYVNFPPQLTYAVLPMAPAPAYGQISAAGSYDPDGGGLEYEWQFDDGAWESTGPIPFVSHIFYETSYVHLRITDEEGTSAEVDFYQPVSGSARSVHASYENYTSKYGMATEVTTISGSYLLQMFAPYGSAFCKLSADFEPLWVTGWSEPMTLRGPCSDGGFYGVAFYGGEMDIARFKSDGTLLWSNEYSLDPGFSPSSASVDESCRLWITGTRDTPNVGAMVCCIGANGQPLFGKELDLTDPGQWSLYPQGLSADDSGNAVLALHLTTYSPNYVSVSILVKLSSAGSLAWVKSVEDASSQELGQVLSPIWAAPNFLLAANGNSGAYYLALGETGAIVWSRQTTASLYPSLSSNGYLYLAGNSGIASVPLLDSGVHQYYAWMRSTSNFVGLSNGAPSLAITYPTENWSRGLFTTWPAGLTTTDSTWSITSSDITLTPGAWAPLGEDAPTIEIDATGTDSWLCNTPFGGTPLP